MSNKRNKNKGKDRASSSASSGHAYTRAGSSYESTPTPSHHRSVNAHAHDALEFDTALLYPFAEAQHHYLNAWTSPSPSVPMSPQSMLPRYPNTAYLRSPPIRAGPDLEPSLYGTYGHALKHTYELLGSNYLDNAASFLINIVQWLHEHIEPLGLTRDIPWHSGHRSEQESTRKWKLKFWADFNNCWLGLMQKHQQISDSIGMLAPGSVPASSILSIDRLNALGNSLVSLCDVLHPEGLVDYEMGIWEEQILILLTQCWEDAVKRQNQGQFPHPSWHMTQRRAEKRKH